MPAVINEATKKPGLCNKDDLRASFALAMSTMYQSEVPLYGTLIEVTKTVNREVADNEDFIAAERLDLERHGAVRLGTPYELAMVRRIFAMLGMYPVDYYDLSVAGLPMHGTAFRPTDPKALSKNPFRMFTTLLRPELLSAEARGLALSLLDHRCIFSDELIRLTDVGEEHGGFTTAEGEAFIIEALKTFRWHPVAAATYDQYAKLHAEHPILADIACFTSAHINHLTPRVLDIDAADALMRERGLDVKASIEGPPARRIPILLRQTSFLALNESIQFPCLESLELIPGSHKARFGEIEQRGVAVTTKGRELYDSMLEKALRRVQSTSACAKDTLAQAFEEYPDSLNELFSQGLIFCTFQCSQQLVQQNDSSGKRSATIQSLLESGSIFMHPIIYEDFLPFSAAGIFRSNLTNSTDENSVTCVATGTNLADFEAALGSQLNASKKLYAEQQQKSLEKCAKILGLERILV